MFGVFGVWKFGALNFETLGRFCIWTPRLLGVWWIAGVSPKVQRFRLINGVSVGILGGFILAVGFFTYE